MVAPTLGSVVPGWLLAVPRQPAINFAEWEQTCSTTPLAVVDGILRAREIDPADAIWFEHGASTLGSMIGCGVDHAHLHILVRPPFSFDEFASCVLFNSDLAWQWTDRSVGYRTVASTASYLIAGSSGTCIFASNTKNVASQFFRRAVARLVGLPAAWDYRLHPFPANAYETIRRFA
jgi:ATP adenylyltransferase